MTQQQHINVVELTGRLGKDPEPKYFPSGKILTKVSLAVNRRGKDVEPNWFDLEVWGKDGETLANYGKKGDLIGIEGELKLDSWTDKLSGVERNKPVVNVNRLELLSNSQSQSKPKPTVAKSADW